MEITRDTKVGDVLDAYPDALEVFLRHGFTPLKNKTMREKMAGKVSIAKACMVKSVPVDVLIAELQEVADRRPEL